VFAQATCQCLKKAALLSGAFANLGVVTVHSTSHLLFILKAIKPRNATVCTQLELLCAVWQNGDFRASATATIGSDHKEKIASFPCDWCLKFRTKTKIVPSTSAQIPPRSGALAWFAP
jgi:hypothetical protein